MKKLLLILSFTFNTVNIFAQTQFWSDNFESAGAPSSGTRTPSSTFFCTLSPSTTYTAYFNRVTAVSLLNLQGTLSGIQGAGFWAGEDLDYGTTCTNSSQSPNQNITWSGINITGRSGLSFKGLFAANNVTTGNWEGTGFGANQDFIIIEYRIDGSAWTKALGFYADATTNAANLRLDADNNLLGEGAALTYTLTEFTASITGTGNSMDLRLNCSANNSVTEEFAVDNFRLFSSFALPIGLTNFAVTKEANYNSIKWTTASEQNNNYFDVQRSTDATTFQSIGIITGHGTTALSHTYSFTDNAPLSQKSYYRLMQVDNNGNFQYSNVIAISPDFNDNIHIYPNPAKDKLTIEVDQAHTDDVHIQLVNTSGTQIPAAITRSGKTYTASLENIANGIYFVKIISSTGVFTKPVLKN